MNVQRFLMAAVAVFVTFGVVYTGTEFVFPEQGAAIHKALNLTETASWVVWPGRILYSLVFCYIFLQGYENKGIAEGARYGLLIGLLLLGINIDWFGISNVVFADAIVWWAIDLVAVIAAGAVLAAVYKPNGGSEATAE